MRDDAKSREYYDDFSTSYERGREAGYHALVDSLEVGAVSKLAKDADVLECGCGTGLILERLRGQARSVTGFDLSPGMVEKAHEKGLSVVLGSVTHIPFRDASFDFVCSFKVLAHVPEIKRALAEMARVTRPGGHMAVELYNPWSLRYLAKKIAGPQPISGGRTEADVFTRWDSPLAAKRLLPSSVELVDVRGVRVWTPAAAVHNLPVLRDIFGAAERASLDSVFRWFGGFLVVIARKVR